MVVIVIMEEILIEEEVVGDMNVALETGVRIVIEVEVVAQKDILQEIIPRKEGSIKEVGVEVSNGKQEIAHQVLHFLSPRNFPPPVPPPLQSYPQRIKYKMKKWQL
jgi:hypothetical protein